MGFDLFTRQSIVFLSTVRPEWFAVCTPKSLFPNLYAVPGANMQTFPPNNGGERGRGYQTLGSPTGRVVIFFILDLGGYGKLAWNFNGFSFHLDVYGLDHHKVFWEAWAILNMLVNNFRWISPLLFTASLVVRYLYFFVWGRQRVELECHSMP